MATLPIFLFKRFPAVFTVRWFFSREHIEKKNIVPSFLLRILLTANLLSSKVRSIKITMKEDKVISQ